MNEKDLKRFQSYFQKSKSGCWLWTACCYPNGYGQFYLNGKMVLAHRASFSLHKGTIPQGLCVLHKCDVRKCVNPKHLWTGTVDDNQKDMARKGRAATGDRNGSRLHPERLPRGDNHPNRLHPERMARGVEKPNSKLDDQKVREIRKQSKKGIPQSKIAKMFGVNQGSISLVVCRKIWKHVA